MNNLIIIGVFLLSPIPLEALEPPPEAPRIAVVDTLSNNCYLYIKSIIPNLPRTSELTANSNYPSLSGITILDYDGLIHYVKNTKVVEDGVWIKESNFIKGEYTTRFLTWDYLEEHKAQYWTPSDILGHRSSQVN